MAQVQIITPTSIQRQKIRIAAYCRVSTSSDEQLNSYSKQIKYYTTMIRNNIEWELVEIYADKGISGTQTITRPEFIRMIRDCELGKIDLIITKSFSRFARNVKEGLEYVRKLKQIGVSIIFEKEGINTQSLGDEMLLNTFAAIAQEESNIISQNIKLANRKRMANGEYVNSSAPYGFIYENKNLIPYEPEAQYLRNIYLWYINGLSTAGIAQKLNSLGIPTKYGTFKWRPSSIARIILNEKNVGDTLCQKTFNTPLPFRKIKNRGEENQYYVSNTHEGIIDRATFDLAQKLLKTNQIKNSPKQSNNRYLLTGKIKCEECGHNYRRKLLRGVPHWICLNHMQNPKNCSSKYISEAKIYEKIITIINNINFRYSSILQETENNIVTAISILKRNNANIIRINASISELNSKALMLEQLRAKGYITNDIYYMQSNEITQSIEMLNIDKKSINDSILESALHDIRNLRKTLSTIMSPLTKIDEPIFDRIIHSVIISNSEKLTITFIGGVSFSEFL